MLEVGSSLGAVSLTLGGLIEVGGAVVDPGVAADGWREVWGALVGDVVVVEELTCAGKPLAIAKKIAMHQTVISVRLHFLTRYSGPIDDQSMRIFLDPTSSICARKVGLCIAERSTFF
jgi:hypothetical protein